MSEIQERSHFIERELRYVFSMTVRLHEDRAEIGPVPGGVRVNIFAREGEVFQVLSEVSPWVDNQIRGTVLPGGTDWAFMGDDDVGRVDVRLAFQTHDGARVEARYGGVFPLGPGGYREIVRDRRDAEERLGTWDKPFEVRVYIAPTFETSHPRYRWLTKLQCLGYGNMKVVDGSPREGTFDIYAMA